MRIVFPLALALLGPTWASGQVALALKLKHSSTMQHEAVQATLEIKNNGETPFIVARDAKTVPTLDFRIASVERNRTAPRIKEGLMLANVYLLPGQTHRMSIRLSDWYDLSAMGHYYIHAEIRHAQASYRSRKIVLEIVRGLPVAQAEMYLPGQPTVKLQCALRYWRRDDNEHVFLSIASEDGETSYGVFSLGPILRLTKPRIETEPGGIVRTVHRTGGDCYARFTFRVGAKGTEILEQRYETAAGNPCGPRRKTEPSD